MKTVYKWEVIVRYMQKTIQKYFKNKKKKGTNIGFNKQDEKKNSKNENICAKKKCPWDFPRIKIFIAFISISMLPSRGSCKWKNNNENFPKGNSDNWIPLKDLIKNYNSHSKWQKKNILIHIYVWNGYLKRLRFYFTRLRPD